MKLYLDNSFLNRLFDDPLISLNKLEGEVLLWVIDLIQQKKATLVHSPLIENENSTNPFPDRKSFVDGVMRLATVYQDIDEDTEARAATLREEMGVQPVDALGRSFQLGEGWHSSEHPVHFWNPLPRILN